MWRSPTVTVLRAIVGSEGRTYNQFVSAGLLGDLTLDLCKELFLRRRR